MSLLEISTEELKRLDAVQFSDILLRLLKFEAEKYGFRSSSDILVPLRINVADAGNDGRIKCDSTNGSPWVKHIYSIFQVKSYHVSPSEIFNEFFDSEKNIKKAIEEVLDGGGQYVFFISVDYNDELLTHRLKKAKEAISHINKTFGKSYSEEQVRILEGNQIKDWVNEYLYVVLRIKEYLKSSPPAGLMTFEQLRQYPTLTTPDFVSNEWTVNRKTEILQEFSENRKSVRLLGHSGVGKTRLVYEIFKSEGEFAKNAVYYDANNAPPEFIGFVQNVVSQTRTIFIIDNCSKELHEKLQKEIERSDSHCSLLTISSSVHECEDYYISSGEVKLILYLAKENENILPQLIRNLYGNQINEIEVERIRTFTDNYPAMAIRLYKIGSRKGAQPVARIIDNDIVHKILYGNSQPLYQDIKLFTSIINALSVFEYFPYPEIISPDAKSEALLKAQMNFIIEDICKVDKRSFKDACEYFIQQKILIRRGRYLTVSPTPLAIKLALEWWKGLPNDEFEKFFNDVTIHGLGVFLVNRLRYLDASPEVQSQIEVIIGELGMLGNIEVLNTELGSRLFSSMVEVNPEASIKTLEKLYLNAPISELTNVTVGRRNLVWSLQKLCFRKVTFNRAARILYRFAQAENEGWSNNSRGIFKQIFGPFLSGTEADFNARIEVLQYAISQPFVEKNDFLIEAIMSAFEIQGAIRMGGPERQGTGVLKDFRPGTKLEVLEYWHQIVELLQVVWENYSEFREQVEKQFYFKSLQINSIAEPDLVINFVTWLESKDVSIPTSFYRSLERQLTFPRIPESAKSKIRVFLISKAPHSSEEKFIRQVRDASYSPGKDENGIDIDQSELQVIALAREFSELGIEILELLDLMLKGQQMYTEIFIQEYLSLNKQNELRMRLWEESVEKLKKIEPKDRNWAVLNGVLQSSPENEKLNLILSLGEIDEFEVIFLSLVNLHLKSVQELEMVWNLLSRKGYSSETISKLRMGHFVFEDNFDSSKYICEKLISLGDIGRWSAFDILYRRLVLKGISDNAEWDYCKRTYEEYNYFNLETKPQFIEFYNLIEISQKLVKKFTDTEFIELVIERLLNFFSISKQKGFDDYFSKLVEQLISTNFDTFWPMFSEKLIMFDHFVYRTKNLIGSDYGNTGSSTHGALFTDQNNWDKIITWCQTNSEVGPNKIALLMPLWDDDWTNLHPFAKVMIDTFGDSPDFLVSISLSLDSYGWVGSIVEYYENEKRFYEVLSKHSNPNVSSYAEKQIENFKRAIEREKLEDEERFFGL